jgi:hypothetical protein
MISSRMIMKMNKEVLNIKGKYTGLRDSTKERLISGRQAIKTQPNTTQYARV